MSDARLPSNNSNLKIEELHSHKDTHFHKNTHSAFSTTDALERTHHKKTVNALDNYHSKLDSYQRQFSTDDKYQTAVFERIETLAAPNINKENSVNPNRQPLLTEEKRQKNKDWRWSSSKSETAELVRKLHVGSVNYELEYRKKKFFQNFMPL